MADINWDIINNATGAVDDTEAIQAYNRNKYIRLKAAGASDTEIFGADKKYTLLEETNSAWWKKTLEGIEDWAVGDDADWQTYWERGLGKSNINLFMQQTEGKYTFGKTGLDWRKAFQAEPEDTGAIERFFETLVSIGADAPTFGVGAAIGSLSGNPFGIGFGAGFVNDSIKEMYLQALHKGDVDTFSEYWNLFLKHGVKEGIKGGLTIGAMSVAPAILPYLKIAKHTVPINKFSVASARWAALTGVGSAVEGQMPNKETMVNNALILGLFGFVDPKASQMLKASTIRNKTDHLTMIEKLKNDVGMIEDFGSKNIKTPRNEKKLVEKEIKDLKEELAELNKLDIESKPKVIESKEIEVKRLDKEIKTLKQNIKEAKTTSIKELNETKLKSFEKELKQLKEEKGTTINEFETLSKKGKIIKTEGNDLKDILSDKSQAVEFGKHDLMDKKISDLYEMGDLIPMLKKKKLFISDDRMGTVFAAKSKRQLEIIKKAETPYDYGVAYGYKEADIAKFYTNRRGGDIKLGYDEFIVDKKNFLKKHLKEEKGTKVIEEKDVVKFEKERDKKLEKEVAKLDSKHSDVMAEINAIKNKKKNNQFYNESRLKLLQIEAKKNVAELVKKRKILTKAKRIADIEEKLAENGQPVVKIFEKNKEFIRSKDKDVNFIEDKIAIGKIKLDLANFESFKAGITTHIIDRLYPILKAVEEAAARGVNVKKMDVYKKMRVQMGNIGKGFHFIKKATFDFKTLKDNGKSLYQVLDKVIKTPEKYRDFTVFSVAKRAMEKFEQGIETGFTLTKIDRAKLKNVIKQFEAEFGQIFKELNEYQQRVLTYLKDAGILTPELYAKVLELNRDYVPLNKVLDIKLRGTDTGLGSVVKNPLKKLVGDIEGKKINIDPIETMMLNTLHFVQIAEKNAVNKSFIDMVLNAQHAKSKGIGDMFEGIHQVKNIKEVKISSKELESLFLDIKGISENAKQGLTVFRKDGTTLTKSQIAVFENGKMKVYEVGVDFATSLKDLNKFQAMWVMRMLSVPTRTLRAGATLDPAFIFKNLGRDTFFAAVFSKNSFIPFWDTSIGIFHIIKDKVVGDALYSKFMKSGAMQSTLISFDRAYFKDAQMLEYLTSRTLHNAIKPKNWLESLRIISEIAETGSRLGDFKMTLKRLEKENVKLPDNKKMSEREILELAGFEARDLTVDFRKMGTSMQGMNMINAFFNARVQGLMKIYEGLKDPKRQGRILWNATKFITLPTLLIWYNNKDSQVYKDLPQWQKDLSWIIITNEGTPEQVVWRIPKPFEIGWIFGTLPERLLDWIYNQEEGEDAINSMKDFGWDFMKSLSPIPEFVRPFMEDSQNRNFFMDRPIVPYNVEKLLPEYQYTEYTSETAKLIGSIFGKLRDSLGMEAMRIGPLRMSLDSPAKVENYILAWSGGLGRYALSVLDYSFKTIGVTTPPIKPWSDNWVRNLSEIPIIRGFVVRHPSASSEHLTKFWDLYKIIARDVETFEYLMAENKLDDALKVWNRIDPELLYLVEMAKPIKEIGDVVTLIYNNDGVSANDKKQLIDGFYENMIDIAKQALQVRIDMKKRKKKK